MVLNACVGRTEKETVSHMFLHLSFDLWITFFLASVVCRAFVAVECLDERTSYLAND